MSKLTKNQMIGIVLGIIAIISLLLTLNLSLEEVKNYRIIGGGIICVIAYGLISYFFMTRPTRKYPKLQTTADLRTSLQNR